MKSKRSLEERFLAFHEHNPRVFIELEKLALEAKRRGRKRIGIKMLWEVMRWNLTVATNDSSFKLNNNYPSRYARLLVQKHPDLGGMIQMRELKA